MVACTCRANRRVAMAAAAAERGAAVLEAAVRWTRAAVEGVTSGLLDIVYRGKQSDLPEITDDLLVESACNLAARIRTGELKSTALVEAYIRRIKAVDPFINAVVEDRFAEALDEAARVDELVESGIKTAEEMERETPFLGIPFSAKEATLVKGLSSTCGLMCRQGLKANRDCDAVVLLRGAGAIPLVVTNTSELCMWWETYNKLHGQTNNPYDTTRTSGGSSGGEAALIAAAGSVIGVGTDLGGSIRLPAFFNGVFGHKPSLGVVPHGGQFPPALQQVSPYVVTGPMTRYASDLLPMLKVLADGNARRLKLHKKVCLKSLKVFYMLDDGGHPALTPVHPEIKNALLEVVKWLEASSVPAEEATVQLKDLKHSFILWAAALAAIQDQTIANLMAGEVRKAEPPHYEMWKWLSGRSEHVFPIIFNACVQEHLVPVIAKPLSAFRTRGLRLKEDMERLLGDDGVFLYPTFPTAAPHHGQMLANPLNVGYSVVFNALGLPVTQCPLGLTTSGLPIGVQVVAADGNDRLTLAMAEEVEKRFGGWVDPSRGIR